MQASGTSEHQESGSIMVNQTFYKAFPLSEEKMPVQCSSDYLQAFLNFACFFLTRDFVQTYFVHFICYHVQLWHGRSVSSPFSPKPSSSSEETIQLHIHLLTPVFFVPKWI